MKKRKGFTLIELLAVIVIIGLLMAIAIPAVTKYITTSRKKTVETSIHEFATAVTVDVNDSEYDVKGDNTIYAIPIECIELEKGGENPFGKWMPANDKQWAYVLVQYDSLKRNYTYGFTFKDSEGYGLYPTSLEKLDGSGKQVQKDLSLNKPTNGSYTNITAKGNWNGFNLKFDTKLVVLWAVDDGDGKNTCTIRQEVNKSEVPTYVPSVEEEEEDTTISDGTTAYAIYSADDQSLTFVRLDDSVTVKAGDIFLNKAVTAIYTGFEDSTSVPWSTYRESIKTVTFNDRIKPKSTANWFYNFKNCVSINLNNLDTSNVTSMYYMFYNAGYNSTTFTLDLGSTFDTSKVTDMRYMFRYTGYGSTNFTLDLGDKFNTINVTSMIDMFRYTGYSSTNFTLDLGNQFDTRNVTDMESMFNYTGRSSKVFKLDLGDKFDTSKVTNMVGLFAATGELSPVFTLDLGDKFDTSNVTDMGSMFINTGYSSTVFTLDLGDKFDTSKVTSMSNMFDAVGYNSTVLKIDLGDKFDTSNVTNMLCMFRDAGYNSTNFVLDLGDKFDTSNVVYMSSMFYNTGYKSKTFTLDLGDKFNTGKVEDMRVMFHYTGYSSTNFTLDIGDKFDTKSATDMYGMFYNTGYNSSSFRLDCSGWNVDKVTDYALFNTGVTSKVTPPVWK